MLQLDHVDVFYGPVQALRGVSLTVGDGEMVALLGANGAGKTTTLRTISGLLEPRNGSIAYDGTELVGTLWLELAERSGGVHAVMKELWVAPGPRRLEHARAVLVAALSACRALEVSSLEVTVPGADGANEPGVYEQLGFEITAQTLAKPLPGSPARR